MLVPDDFTDFLFWFKKATEASWAKTEQQMHKDIPLLNAKWVGMKKSEIDEVEKRFEIKFPPDYREFLKILHTIRPKPVQDSCFFFDWLGEEKMIIDKLNWPYSSMLPNGIWLKSWGVIPDSQDVIFNRFSEWYHQAPKLIPIFGHRYIVSEPYRRGNPVLSVYGWDTIVYGWNLKDYLLNEFSENMPEELFEKTYDEDGSWSYNFKDEIQDVFDSNWLKCSYNDIRCWGELIEQAGGDWKYQPRRQ
ncbi:SMI1/KNR4 family protein [Hymenobacter negativus]|uniref:SMI1/KNR4 family protein n=1 Tax=Hymenobacter negativus TaxID=2795026 RepID=A0ABS3QCW5_9BACT|nr:SMI1/KNR4 family protein [Hymenobacter negativus]MBO2008853.1 SMI1/KNR4 family protein [Hymenobacter negativus]